MDWHYVIGDPVDSLPPLAMRNCSRDDWSQCYRAAERAGGRWVPIRMPDVNTARKLCQVAKKRHGTEAETRGSTVYLKVLRVGVR